MQAIIAGETGHYGNPRDGCLADEQAISIVGVKGRVCAPRCSNGKGVFKPCPKDTPSGATEVIPTCGMFNAVTLESYCILLCSPITAAKNPCGKGASCKFPSGYDKDGGLCMYDDDSERLRGGVAMEFS